jgi:hypothetical protein
VAFVSVPEASSRLSVVRERDRGVRDVNLETNDNYIEGKALFQTAKTYTKEMAYSSEVFQKLKKIVMLQLQVKYLEIDTAVVLETCVYK